MKIVTRPDWPGWPDRPEWPDWPDWPTSQIEYERGGANTVKHANLPISSFDEWASQNVTTINARDASASDQCWNFFAKNGVLTYYQDYQDYRDYQDFQDYQDYRDYLHDQYHQHHQHHQHYQHYQHYKDPKIIFPQKSWLSYNHH